MKNYTKLQAIQWWYWSEEKIEQYARYFNDIETFCDMFYEDAQKEIEYVKGQAKKSEKDGYLLLIDYEDEYSVTPDVVDSFVQKYVYDKKKELILYWLDKVSQTEDEIEYLQKCQQIVEKLVQIHQSNVILHWIREMKKTEVSYACNKSFNN